MPRLPEIPDLARRGPFTRADARAAGVTDRRLQGQQYERLHPGVWRWREYEMTDADWIDAALLAMPERAALSHVSRIQRTGLQIGSTRPVHLTIVGDHHLAVDGIFLHRTKVMPPRDEVGVVPAAAFIQCCESMRLLDVVTIGDHLLHRELASVVGIAELCRLHSWRPGVRAAQWVLPLLDAASRSPKESELRSYVAAAGLPVPEVNVPIHGYDGTVLGIGDLWLPRWRLVVEYEGRQHAEDMFQFRKDIDRYASFRNNDIAYVQITGAMIANPVGAVHRIYAALVRQGYTGPPPRFGARWGSLFRQVTQPARIVGGRSTGSNHYSDDLPPPDARFG